MLHQQETNNNESKRHFLDSGSHLRQFKYAADNNTARQRRRTFTHTLSHNGNEEWLFTDRGITTPLEFFGPATIGQYYPTSTMQPAFLQQPRRPARCHPRLQPLTPSGQFRRRRHTRCFFSHIERQRVILLGMFEVLRKFL